MNDETPNIIVMPAMLAAGVEAMAFVGETNAELLVEVIYRAMVEASCEVAWLPPGRPH